MKHEHPAAPASGAVYVEFREQISQAGERDDVAAANSALRSSIEIVMTLWRRR